MYGNLRYCDSIEDVQPMPEGGGFCEKHGPFDPPHTTCPFCAMEQAERQVYGPPEATRPAAGPLREAEQTAESGAGDSDEDSREFVRKTVEPDAEPRPGPEVTEIAPRANVPPEALEDDPGAEDRPVPLGWLVIKEPLDQRGTVLAVQPNQVIGRAGDVQWPDPRLSRQHARLTFERPADEPDAGPVFHLWPFGPTNPVYVNGVAIRGATPIYENDAIVLGNTLFVFKTLLD